MQQESTHHGNVGLGGLADGSKSGSEDAYMSRDQLAVDNMPAFWRLPWRDVAADCKDAKRFINGRFQVRHIRSLSKCDLFAAPEGGPDLFLQLLHDARRFA